VTWPRRALLSLLLAAAAAGLCALAVPIRIEQVPGMAALLGIERGPDLRPLYAAFFGFLFSMLLSHWSAIAAVAGAVLLATNPAIWSAGRDHGPAFLTLTVLVGPGMLVAMCLRTQGWVRLVLVSLAGLVAGVAVLGHHLGIYLVIAACMGLVWPTRERGRREGAPGPDERGRGAQVRGRGVVHLAPNALELLVFVAAVALVVGLVVGGTGAGEGPSRVVGVGEGPSRVVGVDFFFGPFRAPHPQIEILDGIYGGKDGTPPVWATGWLLLTETPVWVLVLAILGLAAPRVLARGRGWGSGPSRVVGDGEGPSRVVGDGEGPSRVVGAGVVGAGGGGDSGTGARRLSPVLFLSFQVFFMAASLNGSPRYFGYFDLSAAMGTYMAILGGIAVGIGVDWGGQWLRNRQRRGAAQEGEGA
jgi:hypothetical protein